MYSVGETIQYTMDLWRNERNFHVETPAYSELCPPGLKINREIVKEYLVIILG